MSEEDLDVVKRHQISVITNSLESKISKRDRSDRGDVKTKY